MSLLTILWVVIVVIFIFAVLRGFRKGYKEGTKKPFEELKDIFKKKN